MTTRPEVLDERFLEVGHGVVATLEFRKTKPSDNMPLIGKMTDDAPGM